MFLVLFLLFTLIPAIEILLFIRVGSLIGGTNTLILVILSGIIGAYLARGEGLSILNRIQTQLQKGEVPADSFLHGVLVFAGGLLLLTPGFMTDLLGLSMVAPFTRHLHIAWLKRWFAQKIQSGDMHVRFYSNLSSNNPFENDFDQPANHNSIEKDDVIDVEYKVKDDN
jgi:UPF0716 protein FxsA